MLNKDLSGLPSQRGISKNSRLLKKDFKIMSKVNETGRIKKITENIQLMQKKILPNREKHADTKEISINLSFIENALKRFINA